MLPIASTIRRCSLRPGYTIAIGLVAGVGGLIGRRLLRGSLSAKGRNDEIIIVCAALFALGSTALADDAPKVAIQKLGTLTTTVTGQPSSCRPNAASSPRSGHSRRVRACRSTKHPWPHLVYVMEGTLR